MTSAQRAAIAAIAGRSRKSLEERRLEAAADIKTGMRKKVIADTYGVSYMTASRWEKRVKAGESMRATKSTGRPRVVDYAAIAALDKANPLLTLTGFQVAIQETFGVRYCYDHVMQLRKRLRASKEIRLRERASGGGD